LLNFRARYSDFSISYSERDAVTFRDNLDEASWEVSVVDTGPPTMTGGRIKFAEKYLEGERSLATSGDGIENVYIQQHLKLHVSQVP